MASSACLTQLGNLSENRLGAFHNQITFKGYVTARFGNLLLYHLLKYKTRVPYQDTCCVIPGRDEERHSICALLLP